MAECCEALVKALEIALTYQDFCPHAECGVYVGSWEPHWERLHVKDCPMRAAHRAAQAERANEAEHASTCSHCNGCGFENPAASSEECWTCGDAGRSAERDEACPGCATWQQALDQHRRQEHGEQARDYQPDYEGALTIVDEQANRLADLLLKTRQQRDEAERLLERLASEVRASYLLAPLIPSCPDFEAALTTAEHHVAARRAARGEVDRG